MDDRWDVIIVGGGAAGLSAALVLGRARLRTLVIDAGAQSNLRSTAIGGMLGADGQAPSEYYNSVRASLATYPAIELRAGTVAAGRREGDDFVLEVAPAASVRAPRVILATGMDYELPAVEGVAERFGGSVFHCPFCHGWEHQDQPLGVLEAGEGAVHRSLLLRRWSDDVTVYANGDAALDAEARARLERAGVRIDERAVARVEDGAVVFADGAGAACGGLLVPVMLRQRSDLAAQLGATLSADVTPLHADAIVVPPPGQGDGLFAAGDAAGMMPSVANAVAAGSNAAAMVVASLLPA